MLLLAGCLTLLVQRALGRTSPIEPGGTPLDDPAIT